jgi:DNA adenine methylase
MNVTITKRGQKVPLLRPAFKCHGGKNYLKHFIIGHFPAGYEKFTYIEPYSGAASVLLNKRPGAAEILNDLHPGIAAIFGAIKDDPDGFLKRLEALTYSSATFNAALQQADTPDLTGVDLAVSEYVLRRMSRGGLKRDFGWSERLRGGKPGDVNAWETALKQIPALSRRLRAVTSSCRPALEVLQEYDRDDVLAYLDLPYLHTTRAVKKAYDYEMTGDDHRHLCDALVTFKGKALVSGYRSELYDTTLKGWTRVEMNVANHSSQSKVKTVKTECLWMNY